MNPTEISADAVIHALDRAFPDLIIICDRDGNYLAVMGGKDVSKYHDPATLQNLKGLCLHDVMPANLADRILRAIRQSIDEDIINTLTYSMNEAEIPDYANQPGPKEMQWFEARISPIRKDSQDSPEGIVALIYNITDRLLMEQQLEKLARTDELTGLPNRREFMRRAEELTRIAERYGKPISLAMIDIDNFKDINDQHGHTFGDGVLCEFANRTLNTLRDTDVLARIGGEEFALLLPITDTDASLIASERICRTIRSQPFSNGTEVSVSIGVTTWSGGASSDTVIRLMQEADTALYQAKHLGRDRAINYQAGMLMPPHSQ